FDYNVTVIIIENAKEEGKLGLFLVEKGAVGLVVEILEGMDLSRRLTRITLNNTPAEKINVGNEAGQMLEQALHCASFALSAEGVGGMQWILDTAVAYARSREQYGRVIGSFHGVANQLVERDLELTTARSV